MRLMVKTPSGRVGIITLCTYSPKGMRVAVLFPDGMFTEFGLTELVLEGHSPKRLRKIQPKPKIGIHVNGA